jgi:23S rRNA (uracil1939-C5)-methyltransferase
MADGELHIDGIAAGGAGVGRDAGGRVVFVHRTAPGERVAYRVREARQRWARGTLVRVLDAAPERREAPCRFYARCGGCTLEHLAYPAQLAAKASIVADALARIGGLTVAPPPSSPRRRSSAIATACRSHSCACATVACSPVSTS